MPGSKGPFHHITFDAGVREASLKKIDIRAAVHLAFDEFELGDLPFRLTVRPSLRESGTDGRTICCNASREGRERACSRRSISASPVETIWMTAAWPASRSRSIERIRDGVFMLVSRWPKKRCLADSKADRAADFACAFSVPDSPVMFAACIAASRLL